MQCRLLKNFNPRSHEGSDIRQKGEERGRKIFQSTLPRGERQRTSKTRSSHYYFNPRSHEGSDDLARNSSPITGISIHAPTRGATANANYDKRERLFQSTLPRGERRCVESAESRSKAISIHAPTRGATAIFAKKFSFLSAKIV